MITRAARVRLEDISQAIEEALEILDGADFSGYKYDLGKRRGVERCIEIISEASRHVPSDLITRSPEIPWDAIRAIGNHLRHQYQGISDHVIWRTANRDLVVLRNVIQTYLAEHPE